MAVSMEEVAMVEVGISLTLKSGGKVMCVTLFQRTNAATLQKKIERKSRRKEKMVCKEERENSTRTKENTFKIFLFYN